MYFFLFFDKYYLSFLVGANSVVYGATLEDNCFVDVGCTIGEGAVVGQYAYIAPGSVLHGDARVRRGQVC